MLTGKIQFFLGALTLGLLGLGFAPPLEAMVHRIEFDKPLKLTSDLMRVTVERVSYRRNSDNMLVDSRKRKKILDCKAQLNINGRDLATENKTLGEHYFGNMIIDCSQASWEFKMTFDRVLFLGVRNCVNAETMIDSDLCNLTVVAFRNEKRDRLDPGVLRKDTKKYKAVYRVHSDVAKELVSSHSAYPRGMSLEQIDSYQVFDVSITKDGSQFFINKPTETSNFTKGENHYLEAEQNALERDEVLAAHAEEELEKLNGIIDTIESSQDPVAELDSQFKSFTQTYVSAGKKALEIVGPTIFHRLDQSLRRAQSELFSLFSQIQPVSNFDDLPIAYNASLQSNLDMMNAYFGQGRSYTSSLLHETTGVSNDEELLFIPVDLFTKVLGCVDRDHYTAEYACIQGYLAAYTDSHFLNLINSICSSSALYGNHSSPVGRESTRCLFSQLRTGLALVSDKERVFHTPLEIGYQMVRTCDSPFYSYYYESANSDRCAKGVSNWLKKVHPERRDALEKCETENVKDRSACLSTLIEEFKDRENVK